MQSSGTGWMWLGFIVFALIVIAIDIFLLNHKKTHKVSVQNALAWFLVWVSCALIFNGLLWWHYAELNGGSYANEKALAFFSGYLIELTLSTDNMFVFLMVFNYFSVPVQLQRRVLLYGVLGAIVLRLVVILGGTWLVSQLHWILYVFGVFLIVTGIKMLFPEGKKNLGQNTILLFLRRHMRITNQFHQEKFFIRQKTLLYATPLFLVLIWIEISDLVFALDSIPAIFAITNDPFIIFTSNVFAILGLRALYFLLSHMAARFHLLRYGIAIMLAFIGVKMLLAYWMEIPILWALSVVVAILATTVILSVLIRPARGKV